MVPMSTQPARGPRPGAIKALSLEYPMSLGVYDDYAEAQKAVDYLSDHEFPVQNVMIVGTDLKQIERVTGRLTMGRVLGGGALSGAWLGGFVALVFSLFDSANAALGAFVFTIAFGAIFGVVWAFITYKLAGGARDFTSVSQVVATKYEVLVEHRYAQQGRELLAQLDPMRAAQEQVRLAQQSQSLGSDTPPAAPGA
jgi:hypothetical protein